VCATWNSGVNCRAGVNVCVHYDTTGGQTQCQVATNIPANKQMSGTQNRSEAKDSGLVL
jgi:hypothetical protein